MRKSSQWTLFGTAETAVNWQRQYLISRAPSGSNIEPRLMVLGGVAYDGKKMSPFFFKLAEMVGTDVYYKVLRYHVFP